tara:strand:- start:185 stop:430 length:246 start_codon:yes stop_codon:yes gene_type:complete
VLLKASQILETVGVVQDFLVAIVPNILLLTTEECLLANMEVPYCHQENAGLCHVAAYYHRGSADLTLVVDTVQLAYPPEDN